MVYFSGLFHTSSIPHFISPSIKTQVNWNIASMELIIETIIMRGWIFLIQENRCTGSSFQKASVPPVNLRISIKLSYAINGQALAVAKSFCVLSADRLIYTISVFWTHLFSLCRLNVETMCNEGCVCSLKSLRPVCANSTNYVTACHAGCTEYDPVNNVGPAVSLTMGRGVHIGK